MKERRARFRKKVGKSLMACCVEGDNAGLVTLLKLGDDCNETNAAGLTPMHEAARHGHGTVIRTLIDAGADVNARDRWGNTPLLLTAKRGHLLALSQLLEHGAADRHARNERGNSACGFAARGGHTKSLSLLLEDLEANPMTVQNGKGRSVAVDPMARPVPPLESLNMKEEELDCVVQSLIAIGRRPRRVWCGVEEWTAPPGLTPALGSGGFSRLRRCLQEAAASKRRFYRRPPSDAELAASAAALEEGDVEESRIDGLCTWSQPEAWRLLDVADEHLLRARAMAAAAGPQGADARALLDERIDQARRRAARDAMDGETATVRFQRAAEAAFERQLAKEKARQDAKEAEYQRKKREGEEERERVRALEEKRDKNDIFA
jgi:hypothetical protein